MNAELEAIRNRLLTQDNLCTEAPIFAVQQKVRFYGVNDGYSDDFEWVDIENEYTPVNETKTRRLELLNNDGRDIPPRYRRIGYCDRWEFVTACFTMEGAKEHIRLNGHNLKKPRVYAYGSFRNPEYQAVRNALMKGYVNMSDDKMEMMNWLACGERGTSSNTMVEFITGVKATRYGTSHPYDPDDFRRCRLLCEQVSVIRENIDKMKQCSPEWSILVDHWQELCDVMDKETNTPRSERVGHPTYEMMQRLFKQCQKEG